MTEPSKTQLLLEWQGRETVSEDPAVNETPRNGRPWLLIVQLFTCAIIFGIAVDSGCRKAPKLNKYTKIIGALEAIKEQTGTEQLMILAVSTNGTAALVILDMENNKADVLPGRLVLKDITRNEAKLDEL